ncbi:hypothetical protein JHK85_025672 [Glycine max]|nr:hypothetical protein JHK85_025672 [Glycine max]KAG5012914.1 hypothetical protein JHK86_025175 [Glycine max]
MAPRLGKLQGKKKFAMVMGLDLNQEGEALTDSSECRPWGSPATVLGDYVEVAHSGVGWLDEEALLSVWVYRDA